MQAGQPQEHTHTLTTQPKGAEHSQNPSPARTRTTSTPTRNGGVQAGRPHKHTHAPTPQPGVAGRGSNPGPNTNPRTAPPARRCTGPRGKSTQTHTHTNTSPGSDKAQPKPKPKHTRAHRTPEPGTVECGRSTHTPTHAPKPQSRMVGSRPKPKPNRKQRIPQPGKEGRNLNPYPNTPDQDPCRGSRGYRNPNRSATRTHTKTPHKNRKPSVNSPGTEAARAVQVTWPNESRSPGVRQQALMCRSLAVRVLVLVVSVPPSPLIRAASLCVF